MACSQQQLDIAIEQQDRAAASSALGYLGLAYWRQGDFDRALAYLQQARDTAVASGYRRGAVLTGSDMAGVYWEQGDHANALACLRQALEAALEIGYVQAFGFIIGNAGVLYDQRGYQREALQCYGQGLAIAADLGDWPSTLNILSNIAIGFIALHRYRDAEQLYARAIVLGRQFTIPFSLCEVLYLQAGLYVDQGRHTEALPLNREALDIATQIERKDIQFQAQVLAIRLQVAMGEIDVAAAVGALTALLDTWTDESEQATLHYEIWRLDAARAEDRQAAADLYRELHSRTPLAEYRRRYAGLTGATLPEPPPLPPLPEHLLGQPIDLVALFERVGVERAEDSGESTTALAD
jgi:tetratricopeptide (TPR) repeat protein